jgi:hypothetical protein
VSSTISEAVLLVDGHVHIYPFYFLSRVLKCGIANLFKVSQGLPAFSSCENVEKSIPVWLLAERFDCTFFQEVRRSPSRFSIDGYRFIPGDEDETILVEHEGQLVLYILAGRQIVTKENLEILSLISDFQIDDRRYSTDDVIHQVVESGGIADLNWAPGKWFFSRGSFVQRILNTGPRDGLVVSDTPLRHTLWPMPRLLHNALKNGIRMIAGSDPLPWKGEETSIGTYGFCLAGAFDASRPAESVRSLLRKKGESVIIGSRNSFATFCRRQSKAMAMKYATRP